MSNLEPPIRTLMGPGPSDIHPRVLEAMGKNTVGHLDPYYLQVMDQMQVLWTRRLAISGQPNIGQKPATKIYSNPWQEIVASKVIRLT